MNWYKQAQNNQQVLWHGSREKINGTIEPRQAIDVGGSPSSNQNAVYATPNKNFAIMMGLAEQGSFTAVDHSRQPVQLILFKGKLRKGQKTYLYKLPSDTFKDTGDVEEWISTEPVTPIAVEEVSVDSYLDLVRYPTKEDWDFYYKYNASPRK